LEECLYWQKSTIISATSPRVGCTRSLCCRVCPSFDDPIFDALSSEENGPLACANN
jgi:hypothetical protein